MAYTLLHEIVDLDEIKTVFDGTVTTAGLGYGGGLKIKHIIRVDQQNKDYIQVLQTANNVYNSPNKANVYAEISKQRNIEDLDAVDRAYAVLAAESTSYVSQGMDCVTFWSKDLKLWVQVAVAIYEGDQG